MIRPKFQKWRIFSLGLKYATQAWFSKNPQVATAYIELTELCSEALIAINEGNEVQFIEKLHKLRREQSQRELAAMMAGTHPDTPSWLRK